MRAMMDPKAQEDPGNTHIKERFFMSVKYQLFSMNAYIDGVIINDFVSDQEAISYAANYEATCYRINPDGTREMIYKPGDDDQND